VKWISAKFGGESAEKCNRQNGAEQFDEIAAFAFSVDELDEKEDQDEDSPVKKGKGEGNDILRGRKREEMVQWKKYFVEILVRQNEICSLSPY
jgi:hypothetical protein